MASVSISRFSFDFMTHTAAAYFSDASFFCTLFANKDERETLVTGDKVQGTTGRKKKKGSFLRTQSCIEGDTSRYEADEAV